MVRLSHLKDDLKCYVSAGKNRDNLLALINKGYWGNEGITEDIARWRLKVGGYNPFTDKSGALSKSDIFINSFLEFFGIRKPFSNREDEVLIELKVNEYTDAMIAFLLDRSLQEIRIRLREPSIKEAISNYSREVL